jgi:hypothetical protein
MHPGFHGLQGPTISSTSTPTTTHLGLLVCHLDNLVIPLPECLHAQLVPAILVVEFGCRFQGHFNITTFDGKIEPSFPCQSFEGLSPGKD